MLYVRSAVAMSAICLCATAADAAIIHRDLAIRSFLVLRASSLDQPNVTGQTDAEYGEVGVDITVNPAAGRWDAAYSEGSNPSALGHENPLYDGSGNSTKNPLFEPDAQFSVTIGAMTGAAIQIDTGTIFSNSMGSPYQFNWIVNGQIYTFVIPAIEAWVTITPEPWINTPTTWTLGADLPLTPVGLALELGTSVTLVAGSTLTLVPVPAPAATGLALVAGGLVGGRRRRRTP